MRLTRSPSWAKSVTAVTVSVAAAQRLPEQGSSTRHAERAMFAGPGNCLSKMNTNTEPDKSHPDSWLYPVRRPTQMFHVPGRTFLENRWGLHEGICDWLSLALLCTFYCGFVGFFFPPVVHSLLKPSGAFLSAGANISRMTVLSLWVRAQGMKKSSSHDKERDESVFLENIYLSLPLLWGGICWS